MADGHACAAHERVNTRPDRETDEREQNTPVHESLRDLRYVFFDGLNDPRVFRRFY